MSKVLHVNDNEFDSLLSESDKLVFVYFSAPWCGPCKMVAPVIDDISNDFSDVVFAKVNVDENPNAAASYGVRTIPTFIAFKKNELVYRHSGAVPKSFLTQKISSLI